MPLKFDIRPPAELRFKTSFPKTIVNKQLINVESYLDDLSIVFSLYASSAVKIKSEVAFRFESMLLGFVVELLSSLAFVSSLLYSWFWSESIV